LVKLWDRASGGEIRHSWTFATGMSLAFSPDGRLALSGGADKPGDVVAVKGTGGRLQADSRILSIAISGDGRWRYRVKKWESHAWDVQTGSVLRTSLGTVIVDSVR